MLLRVVAGVIAGALAGELLAFTLTVVPWPRALLSHATRAVPVQPFRLVDAQGSVVDASVLADRWLLVQFASTRCGPRCDFVSDRLQGLWSALPQRDARRLLPLWVSTEPQRDPPDRVAAHLQRRPALRGLTGSKADVDNFALAIGVADSGVCGPAATEPEGRAPSDAVFVITPDRRVATLLPAAAAPDVAARHLLALMRAN